MMPLVLLFMMAEGYISYVAKDRTIYLIVACKERRAEVRPFFMLFTIEISQSFFCHSTFGHRRLFRSINNLDSGLYNINLQVFLYVESIDMWDMSFTLFLDYVITSGISSALLCWPVGLV